MCPHCLRSLETFTDTDHEEQKIQERAESTLGLTEAEHQLWKKHNPATFLKTRRRALRTQSAFQTLKHHRRRVAAVALPLAPLPRKQPRVSASSAAYRGGLY